MASTLRLAAAFGLLSFLALVPPASAQSPDVMVFDVGVSLFEADDIRYYGQRNGIAAYSFSTQSCNKGTAPLDWFAGSSTLHPVIGQNMYRLKDGRFEQLGYSWLKHGFCAVNETEAGCLPCHSTPCNTLGIGCADTYSSVLNDGAGGQSKANVNATTGQHRHAGGPTGPGPIRGRLQVAVSDIDPAQNPGAEYFIESQYVTKDDHEAGNAGNNASWRRVEIVSVSDVNLGGPTMREEPAIFAWKALDPLVDIRELENLEGPSMKSTFYLASRVTNLGRGMWHYEYALQNLNSAQGAGSFSIPVDSALPVTNVGFHDVDSHSGDPYDNSDWASTKVGGDLRWAGVPFSTSPNANAIRWGELYNFSFDTPAPPVPGTVNIGLFQPDRNTEIKVRHVLTPEAPCTGAASITTRTGGINHPGYKATPAVLGGTVSITLTPGTAHTFGVIKAFASPQNLPLPSGYVRLFDPASTFYFKVGLTLPAHGVSFPVPNAPALCGLTAYTQAILTGGGAGIAWTNAVDLTAGI
jgi:hypothetical protein